MWKEWETCQIGKKRSFVSNNFIENSNLVVEIVNRYTKNKQMVIDEINKFWDLKLFFAHLQMRHLIWIEKRLRNDRTHRYRKVASFPNKFGIEPCNLLKLKSLKGKLASTQRI